MRVRTVLAITLVALMALATACSSTTVFEADASNPVNEGPTDDVAASTSDATSTDDSEPAPTATAEPAAEDEEEQQDEDDAASRELLAEEREAQLAGLAELCRTDDTRACDVLFLISPINSEYEELGSTCNGTSVPASGWCTDGITTGLDGLAFDESSPALNELAGSCSDGDMMACDFLYFGSPSGGQWEAFGDGCGERTNSAFPDCRSEFPNG